MPFDGTTMGELGGAGATPAGGATNQTVLRGPTDRSGAQGGGAGDGNFKNG